MSIYNSRDVRTSEADELSVSCVNIRSVEDDERRAGCLQTREKTFSQELEMMMKVTQDSDTLMRRLRDL